MPLTVAGRMRQGHGATLHLLLCVTTIGTAWKGAPITRLPVAQARRVPLSAVPAPKAQTLGASPVRSR